jgi:hypothetical protein
MSERSTSQNKAKVFGSKQTNIKGPLIGQPKYAKVTNSRMRLHLVLINYITWDLTGLAKLHLERLG